jgi:hypothetical protein
VLALLSSHTVHLHDKTRSPHGCRLVSAWWRWNRSGRQDRRRQGKSDPLDAVSAARAAQSGRAVGAPKGRNGTVEAIPALMVAKRSAAGERTQTINQAGALVLTGPDELRPASPGTPGCAGGYATRIALRELGRRSDAALPEAHDGHRLASQAEGFWPGAVTAPRHPSPSPGTSATRVHATPVACSCVTRCDVSAQ